ncbi:MAG TPA: lysophospholipid acyltransferase family protein [Beutenbergiaceae bacterium]|nr:lysophospholipid acyltransferase family protein [Beutenbergiaceae bacterium]
MAGKPTDRYHWGWHRLLRRFAQRVILRGVVHSQVSIAVEGGDNVKDLAGPFILISNHSSHLDAPVLFSSLPYSLTKNLATAVAADYFYSQKWRSTLTSVFFNSYPVERDGRRGSGGRRGKPKRAGLSVSLLRQDIPLLIFPEGTRSRTGEMAKFTPGVAALARALRVPVVPVAIIGAHEAMPVGRSWPKPGRPAVRLLIGQPVRVQPGEALNELNIRIENRVRAMVESKTIEAGMDSDVETGESSSEHQGQPTDEAQKPKQEET